MNKLSFIFHPRVRPFANLLVTVGSVIVCLMLSLTRLPGMELLGIGPNWLLIWVVAWSVKRTAWQGAIAAIVLGLIQDGLTAPNPLIHNGFNSIHPSHSLSLVLVGIFTARLQKQRYVREDFISVALIVFAMALLAETAIALQFLFLGDRDLSAIWTEHQRIALCSAILSSLWAPVVYFPLNNWWQHIHNLNHTQT